MDKMTPMDPEYQETPPEWQPGTPGYYGTGRLPKPPRSHTGLIVVLLCVMIVANVITVLMLLTLFGIHMVHKRNKTVVSSSK